MPCNLYRRAWSNMIGNVGEARHGQGRTRSEGVAAKATACRPTTAARRCAGAGSASIECDAHNGVAMERAAASRWIGCTEATCARSALWARGCATPRVDAGVKGGSVERWFSHRSVDTATGREAHRAPLRARIQREPGMAHPRLARLLLPTTLRPSARARRDCDQAMEADTLAGSKKTPQNKAESSYS
jgi:hypothetical protein